MKDEIEVGDIVDISPHWPGMTVECVNGNDIGCFCQGDDEVVTFDKRKMHIIRKATPEELIEKALNKEKAINYMAFGLYIDNKELLKNK